MTNLYCPTCRTTGDLHNHAACDVCGGRHETYYRACPTPNADYRSGMPVQPVNTHVCVECGQETANPRVRGMCMMSDDGEGPHTWTPIEEPTALTENDLEFLDRVARHHEDGARER
jgi:RecJ-like exonuclease